MEVLVSEEAQGQSAMADVFRLLELWACGAKEVPGLVLDRLEADAQGEPFHCFKVWHDLNSAWQSVTL